MIRSMTGYGKGQAEEAGLSATVEVRSVNSRQREIRFRMPQELYPFEAVLREQLQGAISRGRVDVSIGLDRAAGAQAGMALDLDAAARMVEAWKQLQEAFGLPDAPRAEVLLRLPGVLEPAAPGEEDHQLAARLVQRALKDALAAHKGAREREGLKLAEDLRGRVAAVGGAVEEIRRKVAGLPRRLAEQLREKVAELLEDLAVDQSRIHQEVAFLAQRADVTEELVRLGSHLERLEGMFVEPAEEVGRGVEFLVQEVRREVTTIGSKATDPAVDEQVLAVKSELEKIKEQAANLE